MSIETRLEELTKAINELPNAIAAVLANSANPLVVAAADQPVKELKTDPAEKNTASGESTKGGSDNESSGGEIAGRKTYVFDKTTKTGRIIEKGEELPEGDQFVKVGKANWEKLCDKHNLDPVSGEALEEAEEEDDLDLGDEEGEQEEESEEDDDDLGLGDEDEEEESEITVDEVKAQMVRVMKEVGREDAVKIFKKFGARNINEVKPEDLQACYDLAGKVLKKAGK